MKNHVATSPAFFCILILSALSLLRGPDAFGSSGQASESHLLSTAAGVSAPSLTSSLFENPAGLSENSNSRLLFEVDSGNDQFSPLGFGAGFFSGNGSVGGGFELQGASGNNMVLTLGLAAEIPTANLSLGLSASESGGGWGENLGAIFMPHGKFRVGALAYGLFNGVNGIGGGIAFDPTAAATLALDGAYDIQGKTTVIKPGMQIRLAAFQLGAGYGISVQGSGGSEIPTGLSLALGVPLGKNFALEAYYNQLARYYAGVTFSL